MSARAIITCALLALPQAATAFSLEFQTPATRMAETVEELASYKLPISGYDGGNMQTVWAEGHLTQQAWQLQANGLTTLQIAKPLREQLIDEGFEVIFECESQDCGGFDFRYAMNVMPEPAMHVDLGDFRFLSAQRMGDAQPEYIGLTISRSTNRGFVQIVRVGPTADPTLVTSTKSTDSVPVTIATGPMGETLETIGRVVLGDLTFKIGSSDLGDNDFASLDALAQYLLANPNRTVTLVGHTDAEGSLEGNIALSKRRAQSVVTRLINGFGVPTGQLAAQGVGFLSPMASNLTDTGRTQNRRVEAILTSTQ